MFSTIKNYKYLFVFSGLLTTLSLTLLFVWGLKPGIDFRGGSLGEYRFAKTIDALALQGHLAANNFTDAIVQPVSENIVIIKTEPLEEKRQADLKTILSQSSGEYQELRFESIGPSISKELVRKAYWQIILVCFGILLYISYAFRKITIDAKNVKISAWRLGAAAVIALIHDLLITVGFFVIMGKFRGTEIDSLFVTALLTILGFSVHDTIVVFDRIRENLKKLPYESFDKIIDYSVNSTLARSINTSSTLIFVLITMLFFGGQTIFNFILALLVGVTFGTYSSIFIASPLLYLWQKKRSV